VGRGGLAANGVRTGGDSWSATIRARRPWAGSVAAQNRGGGAVLCGPHGTVPVGQVKRHSIDLKINLN
jgi:hypothetical protein